MIKFFRKIRQNLLTENKFSKYLLYAIGEIVLVIIGILFALQINNLNNDKINQRESQKFISRLLNEVKTNVKATDMQINREKEQISSALGILNMFHLDRSQLKSRSMDSLISRIIGKNSIDLKLGTLNEGLNTGKIALITSDSLRTVLYSLPSAIEEVVRNQIINAEDIDSNLTPFLYEHLNWRKMDAEFSPFKEESGISAFPNHNSLDVLDYMLFENLVDNRFYNSKEQFNEYQGLKNTLELLERLIENEKTTKG